MINTISFSYPWWYLIFCVALGVGYALLMYFRDKRFSDYSHWFTKFLAFLRGLSVFIISLLLLSPFVKTIKEDTKTPLVIIATDQSESISQGEKKENLSALNTQLDQLGSDISDKFEVKKISFGSKVHETAIDSFTDKSTNLSALFDHISDNYGDQNLGAVIMSSDGIYNEGSNPLYGSFNMQAPVFTIALGDTLQKKDLYFQNVLYNKIAYLGDKFPIQADISAFNCTGSQTKITLEVVNGSSIRKIAEENINVANSNFFTTKSFVVDANQSGVIRYRLRLSSINGEHNLNNNVKEFFVEILDARQKILLLGNAPHPDLGALKNIISQSKNYDTEIAFAKDFNGNISKYNLVIFHNLPSETTDIQSLLAQCDRNSIPKIFLVGMQSSLPKFNAAQDVIKINGSNKNSEDIQAEFNPGFTLFTTTDQLKNQLKTFPPLSAPFGEYKLASTGHVYLYQNIKKIKTNYPLIAFDEKNGIKTSVICGEGFWKWRLFDFLQNKNYNLVHELVNKTILLSTIKTDKRKFRANTSKNLYKDNEMVIFDAQLYNDSYEMINEPDVKLVIKDENGKEYNFTFSKTQNYYSLNAGLFPKGPYSYQASTIYNGKAQQISGKFNVEAIQLEQFDLTARHGLLKGLSEKFGGQMVYPSQVNTLKDILLQNPNLKPVMYQTNTTKAIIHLKWLFFLILGLLSIEWFLRRYFGNY